MNPRFADQVGNFILKTQRDNIQLKFTSAYRSTAAQAEIKGSPNAITPATLSLHSAGWAVDISLLGMEGDT